MITENITNVINQIHKVLCEAASKKVTVACYGYGCGIVPENINELIEDKKTLESELVNLRKGLKTCFSQTELNQFTSKIAKKLVNCGTVGSSLRVDSSNYENWLNFNPYCRVYESWEACLNRINPVNEINLTYSNLKGQIDLEIGRNLINLNLDIFSKNIPKTIFLDIISQKHEKFYTFNTKSRKIEQTLELRVTRCKLYTELLLFSKELITTYDLDISIKISKVLVELQIFINSFDFTVELETYIKEYKLSSNLEIFIEKLRDVIDLDACVDLISEDLLDLKSIVELYRSDCKLEFEPIGLKTKRDTYDICAITKNKNGEIE